MNDGKHARHFLFRRDRLCAFPVDAFGPRGFAADVDDIRPFFHHLNAVRERLFQSRIFAAVEE